MTTGGSGRLRSGARLFAIPCRVRYRDGVERMESRVPRVGDVCDTCGMQLCRAPNLLECPDAFVPACHEWVITINAPSPSE
jgi:hypothetical protein